MKAREVKRAKLVAKYAAKRAALKKVIATAEDPMDAYEAARALQDIPANANPIRLHNRCKITGRPRGFMRQFGLSRIQFREMASAGLIVPRDGICWSDPRCEEGKLVNCGYRRTDLVNKNLMVTSSGVT